MTKSVTRLGLDRKLFISGVLESFVKKKKQCRKGSPFQVVPVNAVKV